MFRSILFCFLTLLFAARTYSMPFAPDLLQKLKPEARRAMQHDLQAKKERGIDNPSRWPEFKPYHRSKSPAVAFSSTIDTISSTPDTFRVLVLLTDFSDQPASVDPAFFDTLMYGEGHGSVRDFYRETTYGGLVIATETPCTETGWLRLPQTYSYYVNAQYGMGDYPHNAQKLVEDAVLAADSLVDYTRYDNDGDGFVDGLLVVHSGTGREVSGDPNDIHSHSWVVHGPTQGVLVLNRLSVDGIYVRPYAIQPEYWKFSGVPRIDMTVGVFAHEMGHSIFGLPDLYDYDYDSQGLGEWSLMAGGSWNGYVGASPAFPDAWCRIQMGFVTPDVITQDVDSLALPSIYSGPHAIRVWTDGNQGNRYFLIENRRKKSYDSALPGQGLLIYHVDEGVSTDNDRQWYPGHTGMGHYLVALEQADGYYQLEKNYSGDNGDPWPGSTDARAFNTFSSPSSKTYARDETYVSIDRISDTADTASMRVHVTTPVAPQLGQADLDTTTGIVAVSWPFFELHSTYRVYRDDVLLTETTAISYRDTLETPGTYAYSITVVTDQYETPHSNSVSISWLDPTSSVRGGFADQAVPEHFALSPAYPNPFNPTTRIVLSVPSSTHVKAAVFNLLGQKVATLYDGPATPGKLWLNVDGHGWASGTYLIEARTQEGMCVVRRITLLQ